MNEFLNTITKNKKTIPYILLAIGIIIFLLSYIVPKSNNESVNVFDEQTFITSTEQRVKQIVSQIDGVGDCSVAININSTIESVYVKENKSTYNNDNENIKSESQNSVLITKDSSGSEYAVITKKIMPQISGVTVVCTGANNQTVRNAVISAVSTLLDIGTNKVCVIAKAN